MRLKSIKTLKQTLHALTCLAVAFKLLIPIGYMPAPISEGGFMLCPAGTVTGQLEHVQHHDDHHDGDGKKGGELDWGHCPYGALAKAAPISFVLPAAIAPERAVYVPTPPTRVPAGTTTSAFRARAPPKLLT